MATQAKSPKVHEPSLCLSSFVAPNFEPQEMISIFKKSYILQMCGVLHEWLTMFSVESSDDFSKLENGVNMLIEDLKGINAINTSILEDSVNAFIKTYEEYDAMKSSSSRKITKENHQKLLSDVQQSLVNPRSWRISNQILLSLMKN